MYLLDLEEQCIVVVYASYKISDNKENPAHIFHVHVWDQISEVKCVEWLNYFYFESYIVAKKGCQATFKVCYKEKKPPTTPAPLKTTTPEPEICKKFKILKPTRVTVGDSNSQPATISSVVLEREISRHVCQEGVNYFFEGSEFVVKGGCKGVFTVCYTVKKTTPAPLTTTTEAPKIVCKKVDVKSVAHQPGRVDITDSHGNPAHIFHVHVWDQISEVKCVEWLNYFYFETYIVAKKGCQATFKVCYKEKKPPTTPAPLTTTTPEPEICKKFKILKPTRVTVGDSNSQPATISSVVLEREISRHVCQEGVNYFFEGSEFVVKGGCKGVFTVCYTVKKTTPAPLTTTTEAPKIVCKKVDVKSVAHQPGRVDITDSHGNPAHIFHVHVWDQISEVKCVEWLNYFYFETYIVAKKGCQATFKVCYKEKKPPTTPAPLTTTTPEPEICKKYKILKPTRVTVGDSNSQPATISSVVLEREISRHVCQEGVNYFFEGSEFVVKGGCKGVFTVCYTVKKTTPAPLTTTTEAPKIVCKKVDVKSVAHQPGRVDITDSHGNPAHIFHVHVWDQISEVKCVEWLNYFYFESYIVAKKGCQATFKVCYKEKKPPTTPAPLTTTTPEPEICKKFKILKPTRVTVGDSNSQPATISSVVLEREISRHVCQEGVNYFFEGSEFVVKGGCKGVFTVCYTVKKTTPAPLTTTTEAPKIVCKKVDVKSVAHQPGRVDITDSHGNPAHIFHVHVWDQISEVKCVEWLNYFYFETYIVAKKGCQATFKVCYKEKKPPTTPAPLTTTTPEPEICKKFKILKPTRVTVGDSNSQPATISSVVLEREISRHVCQEGVNYFFEGSEFVVKGGCKGVFTVCYTVKKTTPAPLTTTTEAPKIVCKKVDVKSVAHQPGRVDITDSHGNPAHIFHVHVWDQISEVKCVEWLNYFYFESYIVAKKGCQATFKVCYKEKKPPTTPAPLTTTTPEPEICKKFKILKPTRVTVGDSNSQPATISSVVLEREISRHVCQEGVNYFFEGSEFVVKGGCKGVFTVCYTVKKTTPAPLTTTTEAPKIVCKKVDVKSVAHQPGRVDITDSHGNPAHIFHVHVWDQISEVKCVEWLNYFYFESYIVAKKGCQATFKVCYKEKKPPTTPAPLTTTTPEPEICKKYKILKPTRVTVGDSNSQPATISSVVLEREISRHVCQEGVNYFFEGSEFVVKGGCKGVFTVCYTVKKTTPAPLTTTTEAPKIVCKKVDVKSVAHQPGRVDITDSHGNPAHIFHVHVWDQISEVKCVEWLNYFYFETYIVAKKGCQATFKVCYKEKKPPTTPAPLTTTTPEPEICKKFKILKPTRVTVGDSNSQPATISSVVLEREISRHVCQEGVNYFFEGSEFVVKGGCKGVFTVCYTVKKTTPAPLTTTTEAPKIVCKKVDVKSVAHQPGRVDITDSHGNPAHIFHVHVWDQISEVKCVEWLNYFYFETYIVAKKGCQATFKVCYKEKKPPTTPAPLTTTTPEPEICKKYKILKPTRVTVGDSNSQPATISSVVLEREISRHVCQEGVNYFFEGSEFVVKGGCKGVFTVCYTVKKTTPAPLTTTTEAPKIVCKKVDVKSVAHQPGRVDITDSHGNPAHIFHVHVWDQISEVKCVEWLNYFYFESYIVAKKGCQATFKVCYKEKKPPTTPAPLTTSTPEPTRKCEQFVLNGSGPKPDLRTIQSPGVGAVIITSIELVKEFSKGVCHEWFTFFAAGNLISAKDGCKGVFHVCYEYYI
ncbi:hypothetical protein RRG08_065160 [Elysia crispata]|uniref:Uncharacterized protein n=1 Tax=Elysia crispata TaxID=231223 RepID=A0AAE0Z024_9GAST|nr:hypothetical protein RRG08_065160 [Elysia crispata]